MPETSGKQTEAPGCSLAVGRAAKPGKQAPRAPPRDALPGPRPAHPTPSPGRARSQRRLSEVAGAATEKQGRLCTQDPGPRISPPALEKQPGLPSSAAERRGLGGTSREGRRLVATARPGSGAPRSRTGGRRSLPLCPGRAGVGAAAPAAASGTPPSSAQAARASGPLRAARSGRWGRACPSGREGLRGSLGFGGSGGRVAES